MTTTNNASQFSENDPFASLYPHPFAKLTTYRKSGVGVPTTVWFAQDSQGHIYVTTQKSSGKAKRIRNNGEIQLIPSDVRGNVLDGEQPVAGRARQVEPGEYAHAEATLKQKYGEEYDAFMMRIGGERQNGRTYIEIRPE